MPGRAMIIYALAALYAGVAGKHFGSNWWPQSDAEVISDGIVLLMCAIGVVVGSMKQT